MALHLENLSACPEGVVTLRKCRLSSSLVVVSHRANSSCEALTFTIWGNVTRMERRAKKNWLRDARRVLQQLVNPFRPSLLPLVALALDSSYPVRLNVWLNGPVVLLGTQHSHESTAPKPLSSATSSAIPSDRFRSTPSGSRQTFPLALQLAAFTSDRAFDRTPILADAVGTSRRRVRQPGRDPRSLSRYVAHARSRVLGCGFGAR